MDANPDPIILLFVAAPGWRKAGNGALRQLKEWKGGVKCAIRLLLRRSGRLSGGARAVLDTCGVVAYNAK
mgnify:CR=1 FL=1